MKIVMEYKEDFLNDNNIKNFSHKCIEIFCSLLYNRVN